MNKATKGALAALAAGTLMLGGAGTLAFWSGTGTIAGATINSGSITMDTPVCDDTTSAGTHEWEFSGGVHDGEVFDPASHTVVPGDTIVKVCDVTLTTVGTNIKVQLGVSTPDLTDATTTLDDELVPTAVWKDTSDNSTVVDGVTTVDGAASKTYRATVTVVFDFVAATNDSQTGVALLDDVTLTATQLDPNV